MLNTDPHEGNIGIAIRDLHKVPEDKMVEHVAEPRKLRTILDNIQDDADIDCDNLLPLTARQVQLKVFDFGRGPLALQSRAASAQDVLSRSSPVTMCSHIRVT